MHRYNLQNRVLATVITYGKAFGVQGAVVTGSSVLKEYLINFASPFIYSTAMQGYQVQGIIKAYKFLETYPHLENELQNNIEYFRRYHIHSLSQSMSPIQIVQFPTVEKLCKAVQELKQQK